MCCGGEFFRIYVLLFGGAGIDGRFVLRCGGAFGGWCRRWLGVVLFGSAYLPPGVLVRSIDRGLFGVGVGLRVCSRGGDRWDVGRVLRAGIYGMFGTVNAKVAYLHVFRQARVHVAARVYGGVKSVGLTCLGDVLRAHVCNG